MRESTKNVIKTSDANKISFHDRLESLRMVRNSNRLVNREEFVDYRRNIIETGLGGVVDTKPIRSG